MPAVPVPAIQWDATPKPTVAITIPAGPVFADPALQAYHDAIWARFWSPQLQVTCLGNCQRSYTISHNHHTGTCVYCMGQTSEPVTVGTTFDHQGDALHQYAAPSSLSSSQRTIARALWQRIHQYPVDNQATWNQAAADAWLVQWTADVNTAFPSTCSCGNHLLAYSSHYPLDTSTAKAFFQWGFNLHETVNDKLGKASFAPADARTLYGTPSDWLT